MCKCADEIFPNMYYGMNVLFASFVKMPSDSIAVTFY